MTTPERSEILERLLDRHGQTFADQLGVRLSRGGPAELFQLLVGALLMSARIRADTAVAAARELFARGYTDPRSMAAASWQQRVAALGAGGYARYDESTSTYLGEAAELVRDRYDGDLRGLRAAAAGDREHVRALLQEVKGIGGVGADIFVRDVQAIWGELRPFADRPALEAAEHLGLGSSASELADLCGTEDLSTVSAALIRASRAHELEAIRTGRQRHQ